MGRNHGHDYVAAGELLDRARTVTHSNGITQVFGSTIEARANGGLAIGAYQRYGDRFNTYAPDGSSLGAYVAEQDAYSAIIRNGRATPSTSRGHVVDAGSVETIEH